MKNLAISAVAVKHDQNVRGDFTASFLELQDNIDRVIPAYRIVGTDFYYNPPKEQWPAPRKKNHSDEIQRISHK